MTDPLRDAGLGTQVAAIAYVAVIAGGLVLAVGSALVGRLIGKQTRIPNPIEAIIGIGVIVGIPAAFAAGAAMVVTPLLVAMPLPLAGWLLIGAFALFGFWGSEASGGEMGGCTKMIGISISAYGLCWAITAIVLADPPAGNVAGVLRPLLLAAPVAFILGKSSRGSRVKQTIGFGLLFAVFAAIAFLPVERGFAAHLLPASDWLKYPIAGAITFGIWPLLAVPVGLIFGKRRFRWRDILAAAGAMGSIGAVAGLLWAVTRLLF